MTGNRDDDMEQLRRASFPPDEERAVIHERLDLDRWISAYPLSGMDRHTDLCSSITGPLPVAYLEQIRTSVKEAGGDLGRAVPVDLCVWNFGEAPRREMTKIGGISPCTMPRGKTT